MKSPRLICLSILLLFFAHQASAQGLATLHGTITDRAEGTPIVGASVRLQGSSTVVFTDSLGNYEFNLPAGSAQVHVTLLGYLSHTSPVFTLASSERKRWDLALIKASSTDSTFLAEVLKPAPNIGLEDKEGEEEGFFDGSIDHGEKRTEVLQMEASPLPPPSPSQYTSPGIRLKSRKQAHAAYGTAMSADEGRPRPDYNREGYRHLEENHFKEVAHDPLSTFSVDVDKASYANVRRFLNDHQLPPPDAVRIEELINYFSYDYAAPTGEHPIAIHADATTCPWQPENLLVRVGIKGRELDMQQAPASNLVFLLDVSGSMSAPNKLPLLKQAFNMLVDHLRPQDRVAMVVYAGAAGVVLPSTPGTRKDRIRKALDQLEAGGSTAGGAGIQLAYQIAQQQFIRGGNNRVILATDGDFNVGVSSDGALVRMIEQKREQGVFLTVLGFGTGNYQDAKMEQLADKGNGNYAYIDQLLEAKKVLVNEMSGTLFTIAKDVKIQVEFNPTQVKAYRLIGYENRMLNKEDFNDDTKDAGEIGAGHTVTALYELIPAHSPDQLASVDPLKYQQSQPTEAARSSELMTLKFRYKLPEADCSQLLVASLEQGQVRRLEAGQTPDDVQFAGAVAAFGMLLRDSEHKGEATYEQVLALARAGKGQDPEGYRAEFLRLVETASLMQQRQ